VNAFVCMVDVDNLDDMLVQVAALKAEVAVPKTAIPRIGWLAYIKDHDGNQQTRQDLVKLGRGGSSKVP